MKNYSTLLSLSVILMVFVFAHEAKAQEIGIGTYNPDHRLHVYSTTSNILKLENSTPLNVGVMAEMHFKSNTYYTGAIKTIGYGTTVARLGFFTYASPTSGGLHENMSIMDNGNVGIGTTTPSFLLDVNGRMRVRTGSGTAGIFFMDAANVNNRGLIGMKDDNTIGLFGNNGGGWGLTMSTSDGVVSMNSNVYVSGRITASTDVYAAGTFTNYSGDDYAGVEGVSASVDGKGKGVEGEGGEIGVFGIAQMANDISHNHGVKAYGNNGQNNNYGVHGTANGGNLAVGIYGHAAGGQATWAGYFSGSVYSSGSYQGSDRKLKSDIQPLNNALALIKALKPSTYLYKTAEYKQLQLPEGNQYGLIADEVKQVFPSMVKLAIQEEQYEDDVRSKGAIVAPEVSFEAVNYTAMIPVLIAAMQEQQAMIEAQQKKIAELEARIK